tara:strand:+ start:5164 stop:5856 length:693 start_codon:yes stop_codon:yes gene_type:complete
MTLSIQETHEQFLHWYDKQANFASPEVTPEEIDLYLNNAQYQFLKILTEQGLEKSQEWLDYTKNITKSYSTTLVSSSNKPNGFYVDLPIDYKLVLLEEADVTYSFCGIEQAKRIPVVPTTRDEYNKVVQNPFKAPWKEELVRLTADGNRFEVIGFPGSTLITYHMDYLKEPQRIQYGSQYAGFNPPPDQDCELDSKATLKIIEIAVQLALKTMGDPRLNLEQLDKLVKTI